MAGHEANQPGNAASGVGAPADLGPRVLARLIDSIGLWLIFMVVVVPLLIATSVLGSFGGAFGGGFGFSIGFVVFAIIRAAIEVGYFAFMESSRGETVGKMIVGLKTEGPDGKNPTLEEAVKRNAWYALDVIPVIGGVLLLIALIYIMLTINSSPTKTGWHDQFAGGTKVIKIR